MPASTADGILKAARGHEEDCPGSSLLPNPRDVASPWGFMRAYEWGPVKGRKVLLVHGLSTPSPALADLGTRLVEGGCRVMIVGRGQTRFTMWLIKADLWGRGFSDAYKDSPHDTRLYTSQFLLAISTSPLHWTGKDSGGFSIIGYSMGGALAMAFVRWFPQLVNAIVLLAPGGLYKRLPSEYRALRVRFPWMFPRKMVTKHIREMLNGRTSSSRKQIPGPGTGHQTSGNVLDVERIVNWEIDHHPGFIHSVSSALRCAPVVKQHMLWSDVRSHLEGTNLFSSTEDTPNRLEGSKILLLLGKNDAVLPPGYRRDVEETMGRHNLEIHEFDGGHSFPVGAQGRQVAETILTFWSSGSEAKATQL